MDWFPFWLSLRVAGLATVLTVLLGSLIAWPLARARFWGRDLAIGVVNLPLVLPPTVLGYALLVGLGRRSVFGAWYEHLTGHSLVFTWEGAAVAACVASLPLFISQARVAIAAVEPDVIGAARTDGASGWPLVRSIFLPLAWPGLLAGTALAFARALGDFGATLMVAGDTPGVTQTMPLAIYDAVLSGDAGTVRAFVLLSTGLCLGVSLLAARLGRN
ncbi:molybdenum ABC transporter permease subunit [Capsulimonas corticalis]|uniref:Molybdenum transport system permease n=1 Tax=Capsulimonas corticalis TaxID=2219043 RepID=A0A402D594_9BACT|nr:molybdate ABC transporter permease subunit [Capsulimonas corticalis]BDI29884.1 molybdenum ABC transporter permease subunit [Capsulimonas corticalis]